MLRAGAALDGELDAANTLKFERDAARAPELRAAFEALRAARAATRLAAPRERAPRDRLPRLAEPAPKRARNRQAYALAASLTGAALLGAIAFTFMRGGGDDPIVGAIVAGYMRGQVSGQPFDVASSDRHTVKPWLASRVTLGAAVVDLAGAGVIPWRAAGSTSPMASRS
jgi:anti-sigma factor RsiW